MSILDAGLGRTSRRGFLALAGLAVGGSAILSACGNNNSSSTAPSGSGGSTMKGVGNNGKVGKGRSGATADTLFIAGFQWGPPTNFNTLSAAPAWPASGNVMQLIYETPLRWNLVTGELMPGLAQTYKVEGTTITLTWQDAAKWADGQPCTAKDFAYTWQLGKIDPTTSLNSMWTVCSSIEATDDKTAVVKVAPGQNVDVALQNIAQQYVLPQHLWTDIASKANNKLLAYTLMNPVGSGPFQLDKYDQTQLVLKLNQDYWGKDYYGGLPAVTQVIHPIFKSNEDSNLQFQNGQLDVMQAFVAQIWKMWESDNKPVGTYLKKLPYYVPGSMPMFFMNTTKPGLDDLQVRKAIAYAIDYKSIGSTAMSGYTDQVLGSLILPSGAEAKWIDKDKASAAWSYDPSKAEQILKDAGYTKGSDGIYAKGGVRLGQYKLITPTGWTDWNAALTIAAKNLKAIGIDAVTNFPQQGDCQSQIQSGTFDCCCWYVSGVSPATPYQRFADVMSNKNMVKVGGTAFGNYGRWTNSDIDGLLDKAAAATSDDDKKTAYTNLDDLYRANIPAIPLMYRPDEFYEYNASNFYNWADENNSYAPPMFRGAGNTWLFKIKKIAG